MTVELKSGDTLKAASDIDVNYVASTFLGYPNVQSIRFLAGETLGVVTNPKRLGNDGKTYVDFQDGTKTVSVPIELITSGQVTVERTGSSSSEGDYTTLGKTTTTTQKSTGVFEKVLDVVGGLFGIFTKSKTTTNTPPISNDGSGTKVDIELGKPDTTPQQEQKTNNLIWYVVGGLVVFVGGVIGFIVYSRNRKKKQQLAA